ncbi:MAG: PEP-CTERM sorting domain-containing protein [Chromatiaceae bacterium]|nr:PEP-CTERM sorting domain-containing protein [Chromatiaceae bacterium]
MVADSDLFRFTFTSFANGNWTIQSFASQMPNDAGTDGVWHVPEPATTALLMFGLAGLGYRRRRQCARVA